MKTSKHLLISFVFAFFQIGLSLGNNMEECCAHEMCRTANGIARTAYCFKLSSQKDIDIYMELFQHVYPNATTIEDVIVSICKDIKKGKEAFYYYYYEKEKMNVSTRLFIHLKNP
ncbi:uncharacterized protein LOC129966999 isoform X2 [Argiope bruennichi]|uniref:uncharacterized protein LOC129966999 isoform X2 n=1 Tax=Argiope bruennichi TaxID=94029 RepID=UPI002494AFBF|nr:uncharacterized protein LOC129966999 isoform X2 [Argiope bruennichi]